MKLLIILFFVCGCSGLSKREPKQGKTTYSYTDVSGNFRYTRETKQLKNKIVTRNQIISSKGSNDKVLEKSILVSEIGSVKGKKKRLLTVRPVASEFTVWLEGKKYSSRMQLNAKNKSMVLSLESPESKWQGTSEVNFPAGRIFCFFNQIPECLYHNFLLKKALERPNTKHDFYMIWDGYPFIQDQLTGIGSKLFTPATLKFEGEFKKRLRYIVEVEGQMILYFFTKSYDLVKIAWIAQGITIVPPGEEINDDE